MNFFFALVDDGFLHIRFPFISGKSTFFLSVADCAMCAQFYVTFYFAYLCVCVCALLLLAVVEVLCFRTFGTFSKLSSKANNV